MITKISKGYQITIPAKVRHKFGLEIGTAIDIEDNRKEIVIRPLHKATKNALNKLFKESDKYTNNLTPEQLEKMEEDILDNYLDLET